VTLLTGVGLVVLALGLPFALSIALMVAYGGWADSWTVELELWQESLFAQMAHGEHTFEGVAVADLQAEVGSLAEYLAAARHAQRTWLRRSAESSVRRRPADPVDRRDRRGGIGPTSRRTALAAPRSVRPAGQLSDRSSGVQRRKPRQASERLHNLLTLITAVLLAPTLVISVYGANIREFNPDTTGTLPALVFVMLLGAVVSAANLSGVQRRPLLPAGRRAHRWFAAITAALAVAGTRRRPPGPHHCSPPVGRRPWHIRRRCCIIAVGQPTDRANRPRGLSAMTDPSEFRIGHGHDGPGL